MLLNTWLSVARRHFSSANPRRVDRIGKSRSLRTEPLEERMLLSGTPIVLNALVINADNQSQYTNLVGGLVVNSGHLAGKDALVIEGISVSTTFGNAISINLGSASDPLALKRIAIETVTISQYTDVGLKIDLTNVTGLESVAIEDVVTTGTKLGLDLTFTNTDTNALTIDDSTFPGVHVTAQAGADIHNGVVTGNKIVAGQTVEGFVLDVLSTAPTLTAPGVISTADGFQIIDNIEITTRDKDAIQVNATGYIDPTTRLTTSKLDGLAIRNNAKVGTAPRANVSFRADGDTFVQPFTLKNNSTQGELLQTFVFDLTPIGLEFDVDPLTGKPFTALNGTGAVVGVVATTLSPDKKSLTVTFNDFSPGETLQFVIDVDLAGGIPTSIFGNQVIGANVSFAFTGNKSTSGQMSGDPNNTSASQFVAGFDRNQAGLDNNGIHINATALPVTNFTISDNIVAGAPGHGLYLDAKANSDMTGAISGNQFSGSGQDGINFGMSDSHFYGSVTANNVANNEGNGISILPSVTRSGLVESATSGSPGNPIRITSTNHNLQTGDKIMLQGIPNSKPAGSQSPINFPGNGQFTVTRITNGQFSLQGTDNFVSGALALKAGAWYVPDFRNGGTTADSARGFVQVDLKAGATPKAITAASNTPDIAITSANHGLKTGDRIRMTGVQGNTAANGTFTVTVISANVFLLKGMTGNGTYTIAGSWVPLTDAAINGDVVSKGILGNLITGNGLAGIYSDSVVGTTVRADVAQNIVSSNDEIGIQFRSHSYGLGTSLPLSPTNLDALPAVQDFGFNVNVGFQSNGQGNTGGGNTLHLNGKAGIALEALDFGTGGFDVWNNTITLTQDDNDPQTPYSGDGIFVRLKQDLFNTEATSILARSVIKQNVIGVDNLGNEGNGLYFEVAQRTKIQDLEVVNNNFLNNVMDGFHFIRTEDGRLNTVTFEKNRSTNNGGDGFDLYVKNTVKDRLDFKINDNFILDNAQYGLRVRMEASARTKIEFNHNEVLRNGHTPNGMGTHPNDFVPGSTGAAGGIGISVFDVANMIFTADGTKINDNFGDGFSTDAGNYSDTLTLNAKFENSELNNNSLTGFRSQGAAFAYFDWFNTHFDDNGEDGVRIISVVDKTDPFRRRIAGEDIDIKSLRSTFDRNQQSGVQLGQGANAQFGDGTVLNANSFSNNIVEDGLKITQSSGPWLESQDRRRSIGADFNYFLGNGGDGIDIGHFTIEEAIASIEILSNGQRNGSAADGEAGNVEHGDEVITDVFISISDAEITGNGGDGVEYLGDSILRVPAVTGSGQDIFYDYNSGLTIRDSRIVGNAKRGIDILNRRQHDSFINLINNNILSNGHEGVYVVNTASHFQRQSGPSDPLDEYLEIFQVGQTPINPNMELRVQNNLIESNGTANVTSTVPINDSFNNFDGPNDITPHPDFTHKFFQSQGTLGGLVIRVGTADSSGRLRIADTPYELGLSGVDAEIWNNHFDGNYGADVYFDNFVSQISPQVTGNFQCGANPPYLWVTGYRDPLSRFDLSFRENTGNSLDVINGFAFYDNWEGWFKSRLFGNGRDPNGDFGNPKRYRNATRTIGYQFFNDIGIDPTFWDFICNDGSTFWGPWSYDGLGTTTWRVESDFDFNNFTLTNPVQGYSDFFEVVNLGGPGLGELLYQWDTGIDTPSFSGRSSYSLDRGDIFNVQPTEDPIVQDAMEGNDGFVSAALLEDSPGSGFLSGNHTYSSLNINTKADRDYYRFTAADTGNLDVGLTLVDTLGDRVQFMVYEVKPNTDTEEVPLFFLPDLSPAYQTVGQGTTRTLSTMVQKDREYVIEVLSDEFENIGDDGTVGKPFRFGTTRDYRLTVATPAAPPAAPPGGGGGGTGGGSTGGAGGGESGGSGGGAQGGSLPGAPTIKSIGPVTPTTRSVAVGDVIIEFNEDVTGVDIADLRLTRTGIDIPLTGLVVTAISPTLYSVNLGTLTGIAGNYVLTVVATASGIRDTDNSLLVTGGSNAWTVANSVTSLLDTPDTNTGDGVSRDIAGNFTLRAAVMESNAAFGDDIISLGAATYTFTTAGRFEDQALKGDLDIRGNLIIRGASAGTTIIDAALIDRVFHVFPGASLTLENLTIKNGYAFDGGGIFNEGTLILTNVNVQCHTAANQGGGIYNTGTLTVSGSSISENFAGSRGGAVHNLGTSSYLDTTISSNVAVSRGGGIFNEGAATARMINTTIVVNAAGSRGGGIASESMQSTQIGNSILERNRTDARVPVSNASSSKDLMGGVVSLGFNSIQVLDAKQASATSAGLLVTDRFGRDATPRPELTNVLQYGAGNGVGFHALKLNGGAVDAGSNSVYPVNPLGKFDAIGNPRLIEGNGDGIITIDLGAVEYQENTPLALFVATPNPAGLNETITFDGSKSTLPNPAVGRITLWEWDFDWNPLNVAPTRPLTDPNYDPNENFTRDATGVSTTHKYTDVSRTSYIVRLIVTDNLGNKGFADKVVTVGRPSTPLILRPFAVTSDLTPTFSWQASPATYRLTLDNVTTGQNNVINVGGLTTTRYTPPTNLAPGRYRATVTATNGSGSSTSLPYLFDITRLSLTSPVGATFDTTPVFRWADIPGSSRYDIWVNRIQPTFKDQVIRNQFVTTNRFETQVSLGSGTFTWFVRAFDADGVAGDWSASKTFTIGRATFSAPAAVTMNTKPTFTWTNMGAPRYELWVNQVGGKSKIIYLPALTTNSFTPTTPLPNGTFDVWVRPLASDGEAGLWSLVHRFRMDYRVGPETVSPMGVTTDTTPTFTWKAIDFAANYDLWVNNLTTGVAQVIRRTVPAVNGAALITFTPANPMPAGNYRWWVQAATAAGARGAWSVAKDFLIPIPNIITPRGLITTSTPTFRWTGVAEFVTYELWVDNLTTGVSQVLRVQGLTDKFYTPTLPLENGQFRAWVRGFDKNGLASQWSGIADFTINATIGNAPLAISPRFTINDNTPTFTWQGVANAATYEIIVKNMSDGGQPTVLNVNNIAGLSYTTTTTLAPNRNYRWWVRAVSGNNVPGPWSQPQDFRVVSTDLPLPSDSDNPFDAVQLASVVLTAYAENRIEDEVRSITAHPAGTVVQLTPEAAASFLAESAAAVEQIEHVQPLAEIDAVMEEMALDSFFMSDLGSEAGLPITALAPATVVFTNDAATTDEQTTLEAVTAGLLAAIAMPRTVPTREEKRKPQR